MKKGLFMVLIITSLIACKKEEQVSTGKMIFSFDFSGQADPVIFDKGVAILIEYQYLGSGPIISKKIDLTNIDSKYSYYKYSSPIEFTDKGESYKILKYSLVDVQGNELLKVPNALDLNKENIDLLIPFYIHVYKNETTMVRPKMK